MAWYSDLTEKQRKFVEAYVGEAKGNATKAARLAGYSAPRTSGKENTAKHHILEAVEAYREELQQSGEYPMVTPDRIHKEWLSLLNEQSTSNTERITLLRDAARSNAMFKDKVEHSGNIGGQIVVSGDRMDPKEWEQIAKSHMEAMLKVVESMKESVDGS